VRTRGAVVSGVMGAACLVACRLIVGIEDRTVAPGGADAGPCDLCVAEACAAPQNACAQDPSCGVPAQCLSSCEGDAGCRSACAVPPAANATFAELEACIASQCGAACNLTCGTLTPTAAPSAANACESCVVDHGGCGASQACATSVECQNYLQCRRSCVTADCIGECALEHDAGSFLYDGLNVAIQGSCRTPCDFGQNWTCVGNVVWPTTSTPVRKLRLSFQDKIANAPNIGMKVLVCGDLQCNSPLDSETTNDAGVVQVSDNSKVNASGYGLEGYLDLSGGTVPTENEPIFPTLLVWGFPLSEGNGAIGETIPTLSLLDFAGLPGDVPGLSIEPGRAHLGLLAVDCLGNQSDKVTFSLGPDAGDEETRIVYVAGIAPAPGATYTDQDGVAFVFNVPIPDDAGRATVDVYATPEALDGGVSSHQIAYIRSDTLTLVNMQPTP
jgi:hypothetical protein